ncbi:MAG: DUF1501 domain-containing protein [SAR202 cluster bacterium]|nr:hypothetical protein [Chloroflexota bacterium]MQG03151.1 DUF1501 domain-containing protein [SAR202 cluster bacterium]PKB67656.1 MAG: hypothetical protein BZY82_02510 [SAR202 cluster bacterium Io17-Chloro-G3]HAE33073.1 hypothetical protein [Dehalococcoidia bacterium]
MSNKNKDPVIVVLQLTGGNDYMNTVIPHSNSQYRDYRPTVNIGEADVIRLNDDIGFHPSMKPLAEMYQAGNVAIIHGVGYNNSPRSHFRSMDIWHTCEPETLGTEGWLGRTVKQIDPNKENVVTAVSMGPSLYRALVAPDVPVATVENLDSYGLLTDITPEEKRDRVLDRYKRMYSPMIGSGPVMDFLGQTGLDAIKGADILNVAPARYSSTVEYADNSISRKLRSIAQIHLAELGTRVFYCDLGSFDTHADQLAIHDKLWASASVAIQDFFDDLEEHNAADNVTMFLFSEFGRRVYDNGAGTDHGAGGVCLAIGKDVVGGEYGQYPSMKESDLDQGDLVPDIDFRGVYTTLIEDWMKLDPIPIVGGHFEKPRFV